MKLTKNRLDVLREISVRKIMYCCNIKDKRSMNWLEKQGYISIGFSNKHLTLCAKINQKGSDFIGELK